MDLEIRRKTIYNAIVSGAGGGVTVLMQRPDSIQTFPTVVYIISDDSATYTLDKTTAKQSTKVEVDIWTLTPKQGDTIKQGIAEALAAIGYLLQSSIDIPDPTTNELSHINAQFLY